MSDDTPIDAKTLVERDVESLSAVLHGIYQDEARRQAGIGEDEVRHPDDYAALPEHTKEYDRVLARYILRREAALDHLVAAVREWALIGAGTEADYYASRAVCEALAEVDVARERRGADA